MNKRKSESDVEIFDDEIVVHFGEIKRQRRQQFPSTNYVNFRQTAIIASLFVSERAEPGQFDVGSSWRIANVVFNVYFSDPNIAAADKNQQGGRLRTRSNVHLRHSAMRLDIESFRSYSVRFSDGFGTVMFYGTGNTVVVGVKDPCTAVLVAQKMRLLISRDLRESNCENWRLGFYKPTFSNVVATSTLGYPIDNAKFSVAMKADTTYDPSTFVGVKYTGLQGMSTPFGNLDANLTVVLFDGGPFNILGNTTVDQLDWIIVYLKDMMLRFKDDSPSKQVEKSMKPAQRLVSRLHEANKNDTNVRVVNDELLLSLKEQYDPPIALPNDVERMLLLSSVVKREKVVNQETPPEPLSILGLQPPDVWDSPDSASWLNMNGSMMDE
jgi:TATA-box binding protein (TBP) (component of TFIID and TFIIIB)